MDIYSPKFILELGVGNFSTPAFLKYEFSKYIGIDNNIDWTTTISSKYLDRNNCTFIYHKLDDTITNGTFKKNLNTNKISTIVEYYNTLTESILNFIKLSPSLLFVDNYTCCRALAINTLYKKFDIIIYHDCEPSGISWYEYYFDEGLKTEYTHYYYKTPESWTGMFISNKMHQDISILIKTIDSYTRDFCTEYRISTNGFRLEKEEVC